MNTHRNYSLDMLRGVSCIFVILIHYPFPGMWGALIKSICRTAIPFFFMLSGYYTNKNEKKSTRVEIVKRIKKTISICAGAAVFSLFMEYIIFFRKQSFQKFFENYFDVGKIWRLIIWNDTGNITHLWFLFALVYCYIFVFVILLFSTPLNDYRIIDIAAFCLWVILIIFSEILPLCGTIVNHIFYRNALFTGFPFFWVGFRLKTKTFETINNIKFVFFSGIGIIIIERLLIGNIENSLGITILSVFSFIYAVDNTEWGECGILVTLGKDYSLLIYILHWYIICVEYKIINELQFLNNYWYLSISPILVILYSIVAAIVVKNTYLLVKGLFFR